MELRLKEAIVQSQEIELQKRDSDLARLKKIVEEVGQTANTDLQNLNKEIDVRKSLEEEKKSMEQKLQSS